MVVQNRLASLCKFDVKGADTKLASVYLLYVLIKIDRVLIITTRSRPSPG